jgi:hypothetical protein
MGRQTELEAHHAVFSWVRPQTCPESAASLEMITVEVIGKPSAVFRVECKVSERNRVIQPSFVLSHRATEGKPAAGKRLKVHPRLRGLLSEPSQPVVVTSSYNSQTIPVPKYTSSTYMLIAANPRV